MTQSKADSSSTPDKAAINKTQSKADSSSTPDKAFNQKDTKLMKQISQA